MIFFGMITTLPLLVFSFNPKDYPPPSAVPPINAAWTSAFLTSPSGSSFPVITGCLITNTWAATYDDGPGPFTEAILTHLAARQVRGTFFVVGSAVLQYPNALLQAYKQGHQIAIHTWSHSSLPTLTNDQIVAEIVWTAKIVKDIIGVVPTMVRPPYGDLDDRVTQLLTLMGLQIIKWNRDSSDWKFSNWTPGAPVDAPFQGEDTPDAIPRHMKTLAVGNEGAISLEHDIYLEPARQIGPVLDVLKQTEYQLLTVAECMNTVPYTESVLSQLATLDSSSSSQSKSLNSTNSKASKNKPKSGASSYRNLSPMLLLFACLYLCL